MDDLINVPQIDAGSDEAKRIKEEQRMMAGPSKAVDKGPEAGAEHSSEKVDLTGIVKAEPQRTGRAPIFDQRMQVDAFMVPTALKEQVMARATALKETVSDKAKKSKVSKAMLIRVGLHMVLNSSDEDILQWIESIAG